MGNVRRFPDGFFWGAATSSHQVEGGQDNDWTAWEALGKVAGSQRSGAACDHWNRYASDFDIAKELGHNAHRFSVEWSRIEPVPGSVNTTALAHYRDVVTALKTRGMEPFVTLWHFTNPRWFMEQGGWESPNAPRTFARYVNYVVDALPDVKYWIPVNEANFFCEAAYGIGVWPPEVRSLRRAYRVFKNLVEAHRTAYRTIKEKHRDAMIGSATSVPAITPVNPRSPLDRLAARIADNWHNRKWIAETRTTSDFIGINHYALWPIRCGGLRNPIAFGDGGEPKSDFGWTIYPQGMYHALRMAGSYGKPVIVTENGIADARDVQRKSYIHDYLAEVYRAIADGVDVRGYLYWSLLDNFEWREGFSKRFGLVEVDFKSQKRTIRESARWFARVCSSNSIDVT